MFAENVSRAMRYYTIGYNRILHRMISASSCVSGFCTVGELHISQSVIKSRAALDMADELRNYVSAMNVRRLAGDIRTISTDNIRLMQCAAAAEKEQRSAEVQLSRYIKGLLCINNSMFADMSERGHDSCIAVRYLRETLPLCAGTSEAGLLAQRCGISPRLCAAVSEHVKRIDEAAQRARELYCEMTADDSSACRK